MSCGTPKTAFSEADLVVLDRVFVDVCAGLKGGTEINERRKDAIRRRLFMLACNGMTDPDTLRDHIIVSFERSDARALTRKAARTSHGPLECRQRATRCSELARTSSHPIARERYHDLAKTWLALAVQLEARWALIDDVTPKKA
jgi:hypothetical protein